MSKIRIAVAGGGSIGLAHMAVAQKSPTCTLSAVVDPAPTAESVAAKARVPLFKSLEELFGRDRPDGVILATPNQLHVEHALKCIDAGLPMLLEKPIAPTMEEGQRLATPARHFGDHSVFAEVVKGQICGFGVDSYPLGLRAAVSAVQETRKP